MPIYARILRDQVNEAVVQVPGRSFPGAVLQGDQLFILMNQAERINRWIMQNDIRELAFSENLYGQLKAAYDNCRNMQITEIIKRKFRETE